MNQSSQRWSSSSGFCCVSRPRSGGFDWWLSLSKPGDWKTSPTQPPVLTEMKYTLLKHSLKIVAFLGPLPAFFDPDKFEIWYLPHRWPCERRFDRREGPKQFHVLLQFISRAFLLSARATSFLHRAVLLFLRARSLSQPDVILFFRDANSFHYAYLFFHHFVFLSYCA